MKPYPHQIEAVEYLKANCGGFLYIEQRGGKTKPSVTFLLNSQINRQFGLNHYTLIVTKSTCMTVWAKEVVAQADLMGYIIINGTKKQRLAKLDSDSPIVICNWDMLYDYKVLDRKKWNTIIFDESSCIANGTSSVTRYILRALRRLRKESVTPPQICALSGNPAPESAIQYASQAMAVTGSYFGCERLDEYINQFWRDPNVSGTPINKWVPRNPLHLVEIKEWIKQTCFVRTMEGLGLGSEILYSQRNVPMNKKQRKAIAWAIDKKKALGSAIGDKVFVGYLNQIAAGVDPDSGEMISEAKLKEILSCYKERPEPIVVFGFFKKPLYAGLELFIQNDVDCDIVTGNQSKQEVDSSIEAFQNGDFDVLFAQVDLIKMGRDLSRANLSYCISNSFSNDTRSQWIMRTTNLTKTTPVAIVDVCCEDSIDEAIVKALNRKEKIADSYLVSEMKKVVNV